MSNFVKINSAFPIAATTGALIRAFNLRNVQVPDTRKQDYDTTKNAQAFRQGDAPIRTSALGTPVFADVTLKGGSYIDNITLKEVTFPDIQFDAVLMTVDFTSRIVKTEIQGRNGTVKEYIGQDDAKVSIQGVICGYNGHYPALEISQLNDWCLAPITKGAVSTFLQNLGIQSLVVEDYSFPQAAGGYSYQTFSINCISDIPVELKITN
jgi:hypothetical protein